MIKHQISELNALNNPKGSNSVNNSQLSDVSDFTLGINLSCNTPSQSTPEFIKTLHTPK